MRVNKIVCDGCGKEIHGDPFQIFAERVDRETGDFSTERSEWASGKDFCGECLERIKYFTETLNKEIHKEKDAQTETVKISKNDVALCEEPAESPRLVPIMEELAEPEKPKKELPKAEVPKKAEPKKPSIRDLVLQGLSKQEVCRITGCTPVTYTQTKYQLRKKGLLPKKDEQPQEKTAVKCSEVQGKCIYAGKAGTTPICDYLEITGARRGCPTEACTKFESKKK